MRKRVGPLLFIALAAVGLMGCLPGDGDRCGDRYCVYRTPGLEGGYQAFEAGRDVPRYDAFYFDTIHNGDMSNVNDRTTGIVNGTDDWVAFFSGYDYSKGNAAGETWTRVCVAPGAWVGDLSDTYDNKISSSRTYANRPSGCNRTYE